MYIAYYNITLTILQSIQIITLSFSPHYNLYSSFVYPVLHITTYKAHY